MGAAKNTGITRLLKASGYSASGFHACYRHEAAFRQEIIASLLIVPAALWLGDSGVERALLIGSWMLVPIIELLNSAVEAAIDRIGPERHELSARAKDIGSASVALALILALLVWLLVFWP